MHARGSFSRRDGGARASFCRDTFVALCASLLNLPGLISTIELLIVERLFAHVLTPHKSARLKPTRLKFISRLLFMFYTREATLPCLSSSLVLLDHDVHTRNVGTMTMSLEERQNRGTFPNFAR